VSEPIVRLSLVESAVDSAFGDVTAESPQPVAESSRSLDPIEALAEGILPALERPPCFVLFSGGRDSSLMLAIAVRVARREGLALPIPVTHVFPDYPETQESEWQELVLDHLGLRERFLQVFHSEMNFLGSIVQTSIRRNGLIAPAGSHLLVPTLAEARGGSVITGQDGDGLFNGGSFNRARAIVRGRERPTLRLPLTLARALAPQPIRRAVAEGRISGLPTWLQPSALEELKRIDSAEAAGEPMRWNNYVRWWRRRRYLAVRRQAMARLGEAHDVLMVHPLMESRFVHTMALRGGAWGWENRTAALRALFPGLLPDAVYRRETKAVFTRPYWGGEAREFIAGWDGRGLPENVVHVDELRAVWARERPNAHTALLLHAAWAATLPPGEVKEPFNCRFK
jgi:asparagine synthase (glutamine-hydrolysing)